MTLDDALIEACSGHTIRREGFPGHVEHDFKRGFLRVFDVGGSCDFIAKTEDSEADWSIYQAEVAPTLAEDHSPADKWGVPSIAAIAATLPLAPPTRDLEAEAFALLGKSSWGVALPGAVPVIDVDVPKRDAWGVPKV